MRSLFLYNSILFLGLPFCDQKGSEKVSLLRGSALGGQNDGRQFAAQTRSCGYSPRWGEHCSLPSFATLNCGPLLATPQSPKAGLPRFRK